MPEPSVPPSPLPPQNTTPANAPPAESVTIFSGCVSQWMGFKSYLFALFIDALGIAALIYGSLHHEELIGTIGIIAGLALLLASTAMLFYVFLSIRSTRYKITTRLIERESGLIMKKVDALDLGRVKHVDMKQSFVERALNVGTIEVYSSDREEPQLLIEDIPNVRPVYEKLRDAVIDLSRRRGIIVE
jgi:membrane protein YdbS with pleckstrin-like domain